jgi:hypothetical protein
VQARRRYRIAKVSVVSTGSAVAQTESKRRELAVAAVVLVVGVALGLVDQFSPETDAGLRVPALISALFLVASALNVVLPIGAKGHVEPEVEPVADVEVESAGAATYRGRASTEPAAPARVSPAVPLLLMGLATWLGLATLRFSDAPWQLSGLSLLAAFLIFSRGLADLPGR